jgi:hypothetical protein
MTVVLGLLIRTHARLRRLQYLNVGGVLLLEFARFVVLVNHGLEVGDGTLLLPGASLDVPIEPLDKVELFTVLNLHVEDLLDLVVFGRLLALHLFADHSARSLFINK